MFISGHEHKPTYKLENVTNYADLLSIAAGATTPPKVNNEYTYCYNIIEFEWKDEKGLMITLHPRIWSDETKSFEEDKIHYDKDKRTFTLKCPNLSVENIQCKTMPASQVEVDDNSHSVSPNIIEEIGMTPEKQEQLVLLRFFRDLTGSQRRIGRISFLFS